MELQQAVVSILPRSLIRGKNGILRPKIQFVKYDCTHDNMEILLDHLSSNGKVLNFAICQDGQMCSLIRTDSTIDTIQLFNTAAIFCLDSNLDSDTFQLLDPAELQYTYQFEMLRQPVLQLKFSPDQRCLECSHWLSEIGDHCVQPDCMAFNNNYELYSAVLNVSIQELLRYTKDVCTKLTFNKLVVFGSGKPFSAASLVAASAVAKRATAKTKPATATAAKKSSATRSQEPKKSTVKRQRKSASTVAMSSSVLEEEEDTMDVVDDSESPMVAKQRKRSTKKQLGSNFVYRS